MLVSTYIYDLSTDIYFVKFVQWENGCGTQIGNTPKNTANVSAFLHLTFFFEGVNQVKIFIFTSLIDTCPATTFSPLPEGKTPFVQPRKN
jgi:hypothetical protein